MVLTTPKNLTHGFISQIPCNFFSRTIFSKILWYIPNISWHIQYIAIYSKCRKCCDFLVAIYRQGEWLTIYHDVGDISSIYVTILWILNPHKNEQYHLYCEVRNHRNNLQENTRAEITKSSSISHQEATSNCWKWVLCYVH